MERRLLLITPAYNEADSITRVARALAAQTRPPDLWIVADDGSTDGTVGALHTLASQIPFLRVVERPPESSEAVIADRLAVALEARAFNRALRTVDDLDAYSYVGKLDADIELPPEWFETLLRHLELDPRLGIAGGRLRERAGSGWHRLEIPSHHVHGATKLYTRACLAAIGGIQERLAWDTIDETYARMRGFATRSFDEIEAIHLRPRASADGQLRGWARHGECAWILHYGPVWVTLRSAKVALRERPRGLSGAAFLLGYVRSATARHSRVDDREFRRFTRRELRRRLTGGTVESLGASEA